MINGEFVRPDCFIEIHSDVFEAGRNESRDGDEPGGSASSALRYAQPFVESVGGAEGSQGDSIRVYG